MKSLCIIFSLIAVGSGLLLPTSQKWDTVKVGWGYNPSAINPFEDMPKTIEEADKLGYKKFRECTADNKFPGVAYSISEELDTVVLYDVNGKIAGMQLSIPELQGLSNLHLEFPFLLIEKRWTLTFYFINPAKICTTGRTQEEFDQYVVGNELYLQINEQPEASISISLTEDSLDTSKWIKSTCLPLIGQHYFLKLVENPSCEIDLPVHLVYVSGKLIGFGLSLVSKLLSPVTPSIPVELINLFRGAAPSCLREAPVIDECYVFLTGPPQAELCL